MFIRSLTRILTEQTIHLAKQSDKTPTTQCLANLEASHRLSNQSSPIDLILTGIQSQDQSHILWAFSSFVKLDSFGHRAFLALSKMTELFRSESCNIEYATISCCTQIVRSFGDFIVSPFITPILRRLRESPAVESVSCLDRLLRYLSFDFIKQIIFPMLL
jgi:hypothetical protein